MIKDETILKGALQVFGEFGYHESNMDMVAKKAKVVKATLYHHFQNKEELFLATIAFIIQGFVEDIGNEFLKAKNDCEKIKMVINGQLAFYAKNRSACQVLIRESWTLIKIWQESEKREDNFIKTVTQIIKNAQTEGKINKKLNPKLYTLMIFQLVALEGLAYELLRNKMPVEKIHAQISELYLKMVC